MLISDWLFYVAVGFAAQLVDGAIGMAYGLTATSVLLGAGLPPVTASACVHAAEMFTTGASGLAHWGQGNLDRRLIVRLLLPGMIGGAVGAFLLVHIPGELVKPWVSAYLLVLGLVILLRAVRGRRPSADPPKGLAPLGFFGGLLDAIGGGGWGPIVTSTLVGNGVKPRFAIGSVNVVEFFVTLTITLTFVTTIGIGLWPIIAALIAGGALAAPLAAVVARRLPDRLLMAVVGLVIVALSSLSIARIAW